MDLTPQNKKTLTRWIIGIAAVCILIYLSIRNIGAVINTFSALLGLVSPLIIGLAFALVLNVPMSFFESRLGDKTKKPVLKKLCRPISFIISLVLILGILAGVIRLVIPEFIGAVKVAVQTVSDFVGQLNNMSDSELAALPFGEALLNLNWDQLLNPIQSWLKNQGGTIVNTAFGTLSSLVGGIFDLFIALVFSVYILFGKDKLKNQLCRLLRAWLPKDFGEWLIHASSVTSKVFRSFISGQTLEAAILGILCMLGMLLLQIPYAPMVGALVGVTALIPVAGAFIGAIVGAFIIMTVSPIKALIFIVFLVVLQQLEENLIYPRVMGSRVNLPGIWILAAVTVGGNLAGPLGMLLGVPVAATAYVLVKEATLNREKKLKEANKKKNPPHSASNETKKTVKKENTESSEK